MARFDRLSLVARGSWGQFVVAVMLITVLPGLAIVWVWQGGCPLDGRGDPATLALGVVVLLLVALGYILLARYPVNILRLRAYLRSLTQNRLPEHIALTEDEDDIAAIRGYLEQIVHQAEERLRLLEEKQEAALQEERRRIMMESIGALCHHVGQPAAVLGMCLHRLAESKVNDERHAIVVDCQRAFDDIADTLDRLRDATHYSTEPYLAADPDGIRIIRLDRGGGGEDVSRMERLTVRDGTDGRGT